MEIQEILSWPQVQIRPNLSGLMPTTLPPLEKKTYKSDQFNQQQRSKNSQKVGLYILAKRDREQQSERIQKQKRERQNKIQEKQKSKIRKKQQKERQRREDNQKLENQRRKLQEQARLKQLQISRLEQQKQIDQKAKQQEIENENNRKIQQEQINAQNLIAKEIAAKKAEEQRQHDNKRKAKELQRYKSARPAMFLDLIVDYANTIKQEGQIKCAINSVGDIRKASKDLLIWTDSFIEKIDVNDNRQLNTFCVKLWNVIINELIMKAKKSGIQIIPPTRPDEEIFKNCINTYILMINVLRAKGLEKVWLYMVGKTLGLLDFIYKRVDVLSDFKKVDLVEKGYIKKFGDSFQNIYFSRLDQISYFLFGLLLMNPYDCFMQIAKRTNNLPNNVKPLFDRLNKNWNYSLFWLLVEEMRALPFKYFKPVCYSNILSIMNIQMVEARVTGKNKQFLNLYKSLVDQYLTFAKIQAKDPEIKFFMNTNVDGYMDGEEFIDMLAPIKAMGTEKKKLLEGYNIQEVQKKGSVLYYFKTEELQ